MMSTIFFRFSLLGVFFHLFQSVSFGQLVIEKTVHDFGDVTATSNRITDFYIINQYKESLILSTFFLDFEVSTTYTPIELEPGDTLQYRVQIKPDYTGPFEKTIPISFFNHTDTIKLQLKANVLTTDFEDNSFLEQLPDKLKESDEPLIDFPVKLKIVDAETQLPIPDASINFYSKSPPYKRVVTDANGNATRMLNNRYDMSIYAYGYESKRVAISVGCNDSMRVIPMTKNEYGHTLNETYTYEYESKNPIVTPDTISAISKAEEEAILQPLAEGNFKPNNIVFLMDISISMKDHNRMTLLKTAIAQLVSLLRPNDYVSIITFSEDTKTIVPPMAITTSNQSVIIRKIKSLKPGGLTNGGKGLKVAFKLIQENFSADKNNQVILATDGALGSYMRHENIIKMVKKNQPFATTSVVTLHGYNWSKKFMAEIVAAGKGKLLPINNELEAKLRLVKAIKANSILR